MGLFPEINFFGIPSKVQCLCGFTGFGADVTSQYITSPNMFTLSLSASMFKGQFSMDYSGMIAATVLIMIPQLIFYIFLQKYIISGMTEGAVKA